MADAVLDSAFTIYHAQAADILSLHDKELIPGRCRATETIDLSKPLFICAGGIETNSLRRSCGYLNTLCGLLGREAITDKNLNFYTLTYPDYPPEMTAKIMEEYTGQNKCSITAQNETNIYAEKLLKAMDAQLPDLMGLSGTEREQQLALMAARLRNINFFSFSLGTFLVTSFHQALHHHLCFYKGATDEEVEKLMKNVKVLTMGEMGLWQYEPQQWCHFTSVHAASSTDDMIYRVCKFGGHPEPRLLPFGNYTDVREANELLLLTQLDFRHPDGLFDKTGHMLKTYVAEGFPAESHNMLTRKMAQTALRNYLACSQGVDFTNTFDMACREPLWDDGNKLDITHAAYAEKLGKAVLAPEAVKGNWASFIQAVTPCNNTLTAM